MPDQFSGAIHIHNYLQVLFTGVHFIEQSQFMTVSVKSTSSCKMLVGWEGLVSGFVQTRQVSSTLARTVSSHEINFGTEIVNITE
jgi:hypothetical protein